MKNFQSNATKLGNLNGQCDFIFSSKMMNIGLCQTNFINPVNKLYVNTVIFREQNVDNPANLISQKYVLKNF